MYVHVAMFVVEASLAPPLPGSQAHIILIQWMQLLIDWQTAELFITIGRSGNRLWTDGELWGKICKCLCTSEKNQF